MAWYNIFSKSEKQSVEVVEGYQYFSTQFVKIGGANLALHSVNGKYFVGFQLILIVCVLQNHAFIGLAMLILWKRIINCPH